MDNLCHSLVGATLAKSGLERRTSYAMTALVIGANLPDIDVVAAPLGQAIAWRRGWTHGVVALAVLPLVLTAAILAWDRWRRGRGRAKPATPPAPRQLLLLAFIAVLTHPTLDFMNSYGVRWLKPFSDRWYHGDVLFIVDPWLWLALLAGFLWSRSRTSRRAPHAERPARLALAASAAYIVAMTVIAAAERATVLAVLTPRGVAAERVMVAPVAADPFRREVIFEEGSGYHFGEVRLLRSPSLAIQPGSLDRGDDDPDAQRARRSSDAQAFLHWARFPFYRVERGEDGVRVRIIDARYGTTDGSWASWTVRLPMRIAPTVAPERAESRAR